MKTFAIFGTLTACLLMNASAETRREFINPDTLYQSAYYTQAIATTGGRTIYTSGQWAYTPRAELVGRGDLRAQAIQSFQNLKAVLAAAGAKPEDVVKVNLYVVNYRPEDLPAVNAGMSECFGDNRRIASTIVGVQALARPGMLFEVEAIAVTD